MQQAAAQPTLQPLTKHASNNIMPGPPKAALAVHAVAQAALNAAVVTGVAPPTATRMEVSVDSRQETAAILSRHGRAASVTDLLLNWDKFT